MRFMHIVAPVLRLFRPAPPSPPEDPLTALESGSQELIMATLQDGEMLRKLAGLGETASSSVPSVERAAQQRIAQLLDAGAIDFAGLCASSGNISSLLSVAGMCTHEVFLSQALASIDDPQRAAELVLEGSSSRIRQLAAQRIEDPAALKQLLKQVRDKDKSVYKIIKQKCDVLRAEERRIAQIETDVIAACESLERHSHRIYDAIYEPSLKHFDARWQTLEKQAAQEIRERARQALERCRQIIAGHWQQQEQQATEKAHLAARQDAREEAIAQAGAEALRRDEVAALAAAEAAKVREVEERARAERVAAEALALRQLGGLIGKARSALRDGNTGRAAALRRAIEEKAPTAPAVPAYLASQIHQLDVKLNELKEWKDYAVAPKRAELIEEMEALIGSSYEPRALADRIKQLQEDWKTISRGIVSDSEADWQRFQQASVSAYQPCRDYFEALAKQRHANAEKRKGVLERVKAFESTQQGEHWDWRGVAAVLREAPQEWRRYFPVERAAGRAVQDEFDASIGRLQARLDAWYAQNAEEKRSLILRAQHLRTQKDSREAVDAVKRLQLKWQEVGAVQRDVERLLWEEFREQCDAVYQKRQQAHAEYTAGLEANKTRAMALCEEAEQVAALSGPALLEGMARIPQWRAAFDTFRDMPRNDERALHDRFERALHRCQAEVLRQRAREKERSFTHLLEAAGRIHAYAWAVAQSAAFSEREALKQAAETFIAGIQHWPKGGAQALTEAWSKAEAADLDFAARETALRMLCVRSEIITDRPTPPQDHALRRDFQVRRLVQRMGERNEADPDELDALILEWVRVGPVAPATHDTLLARFRAAGDKPAVRSAGH